MGAQVLLNISKDEKERARLTSEYKFAVDLQSKMVDARRDGRAEGRKEERIKNAKALLDVLDIKVITERFELTPEEVEGLKA